MSAMHKGQSAAAVRGLFCRLRCIRFCNVFPEVSLWRNRSLPGCLRQRTVSLPIAWFCETNRYRPHTLAEESGTRCGMPLMRPSICN